jgi:hypothetical protein
MARQLPDDVIDEVTAILIEAILVEFEAASRDQVLDEAGDTS